MPTSSVQATWIPSQLGSRTIAFVGAALLYCQVVSTFCLLEWLVQLQRVQRYSQSSTVLLVADTPSSLAAEAGWYWLDCSGQHASEVTANAPHAPFYLVETSMPTATELRPRKRLPVNRCTVLYIESYGRAFVLRDDILRSYCTI